MAHEVPRVCRGVGRDVERLVGADTCHRAAGDVADGVAACLAGGESGGADDAHEFRRVIDLDVVELEVLARRRVALLQGSVLLGHDAEGVELIGVEPAEGDLDADHLGVGLSLAVDALLEPERLELGLVPLAGLETA